MIVCLGIKSQEKAFRLCRVTENAARNGKAVGLDDGEWSSCAGTRCGEAVLAAGVKDSSESFRPTSFGVCEGSICKA